MCFWNRYIKECDLIMKIINLDYQKKSITGGHKYNDLFLNYLCMYSGCKIINTPKCSDLYPFWRKTYSPFAELRRLHLFKNGDVVFWNDTNYKHHILLAIFSYIFKKVHSVVIIHHFPYLGKRGGGRIFSFTLQYLYYSLCRSIVVPSPFTFDLAKKLFPRKQVYYIPLPFEHEFTVSSTYEKGNLLYVGTIDERKGLKYLINALGLLMVTKPQIEIELNIVGKITDQKYYHKLLVMIEKKGLGDKIHFLGRVSDDLLKECYQKAEVFVFPSLLEGYGIVLIEAMSKGLPIVAFNNSAIPYSISDGKNGLLARNKDSHSFAEKLITICGNEAMRRHLQNGMKETIDSLKTKDDFEKGIRDFVKCINIL